MNSLERCEVQGKARFPTYWAAMRVRIDLNRKKHHLGGCVYWCSHCHGYHISHYNEVTGVDDITTPKKTTSKKELRSKRKRVNRFMRRYSYPVTIETETLLLNLKHKTTMAKILFTPGMSEERKNEALNYARCVMMNNMGIAANVAYYCIMDALDKAKLHPSFRQATKKAVNDHPKAWDRWFMRMQDPSQRCFSTCFFDLSIYSEDSKKIFRDGITNREYFELWQATGGEAYAKSRELMGALRHKFQRVYTVRGVEHAEILAWLDVASAMITLCVSTFETIMDYFERDKLQLMISPRPRQLFSDMDPNQLMKDWMRIRDRFFVANFSREESDNISLTIRDIHDRLFRYDLLSENVMSAVDSYGELMRSRGTIMKMKMEAAEEVERIRNERFSKRIEELKTKNNEHEKD